MIETVGEALSYSASQVYGQEKRDVRDDCLRTAREIGGVRLNHSRLNLFSSLSEDDKEDNFKFKVLSHGKVRMGLYGQDNVRIQIRNSRRQVIADSKAGTGAAHDRFIEITEKDGTKLEKSDYYITVTRLDSDDSTTQIPYSIQLQMGDKVRADYDTTEYKAKKTTSPSDLLADYTAGAGYSAIAAAAKGAAAMISDGAANMKALLGGNTNLWFAPYR